MNRAGERVDPAQVDRHRAVGGDRPRLVTDVERVAAQQLDLLTGPHRHCRLQVAVPPVVHDAAVSVKDAVPGGAAMTSGVPEPATSTAAKAAGVGEVGEGLSGCGADAGLDMEGVAGGAGVCKAHRRPPQSQLFVVGVSQATMPRPLHTRPRATH